MEWTKEKLELVMYMMTLSERPEKRQDWIKRGFRRIHARGKGQLLQYWVDRMAVDPSAHSLYRDSLVKYEDHLAKLKAGKIPTKVRGPVSDEDFNRRLEVCKGCDKLDMSAMGETGACMACGCAVQTKLRIIHETCPLDKWGSLVPVPDTPPNPVRFGCTNPASSNYNPQARYDDGSCLSFFASGGCLPSLQMLGDEDTTTSFAANNGVYYPSCFG